MVRKKLVIQWQCFEDVGLTDIILHHRTQKSSIINEERKSYAPVELPINTFKRQNRNLGLNNGILFPLYRKFHNASLKVRHPYKHVSDFVRERIAAYQDHGLSYHEISCRVERNGITVVEI